MTTTNPPNPARGVGERFFLLLCTLYPREFRRIFRNELLTFFREDRSRARNAGTWHVVLFWFRTTRDLVVAVASERGRARRSMRSNGGGSQLYLSALTTDIRQAIRGLLRDPGYSAVAIATFALGIGATTAMFSVVHAVLLTPLPYPESDRLVQIFEFEGQGNNADWFAYGNYLDVRDQTESFESIGVWAYETNTLATSNDAVQLKTRSVSASFFQTLRVNPVLGRQFLTEDESGLNGAVIVLSHTMWSNSFGSDSAIVGTSVLIDDTPTTVIGVMPAGFDFPFEADAWTPLAPETDPFGMRRWHRYRVLARLKPDISIVGAQRDLLQLSRQLEQAYPETNTNNTFSAVSLLDQTIGKAGLALKILFAAVATLLLIACVNIGSLALARTTGRRRELLIRTALGAGRSRLLTLLLGESVLLSVAGGMAGLLAAWQLGHILISVSAGAVPRIAELTIAPAVVAFAFAASAFAGILVGALSALKLGRERKLLAGRATATDIQSVRMRNVLVTAQIGLTIVLAGAATVLVKSYVNLHRVDTGVEADRILAADLDLPTPQYPTQTEVAQFYTQLIDELQALPGVERAAATHIPPATGVGWRNRFRILGRVVEEASLPSVAYVITTPAYFETVGIPLLGGRSFERSDLETDQRVVVLNETAARQFFPDDDAIGQQVMGNLDLGLDWATVVGIVGDVRESLDREPVPTAYVPLTQDRVLDLTLLVKSNGDPGLIAPRLREIVRALNPAVPLVNVVPLTARIGETISQPRFNSLLSSAFAILALTLSTVGVYGLLRYTVLHRKKEIGLRIAIGASPGSVVRMVLAGTLRVVVIGSLLGVASLVALSRILVTQLYDVRATDPMSLLLVVGVVCGAAVTATLLPARSAAQVDPTSTLRPE